MPKAGKPKDLRDLITALSEKELRETEENLDAYLQVVLRIFNRIEREQEREL